MQRKNLLISTTLVSALCCLGVHSIALAQEDDENRVSVLQRDYENRENHTIDLSIPASPGLVLAGVSADDQIGHNLGADLSYDIGTTPSGAFTGAVTFRPYWTLLRGSPTGEPPQNPGPIEAMLRRTQVSAALAQRQISGNARASAGLGVVFYPYTANDPRTDDLYQDCLNTALGTLRSGGAIGEALRSRSLSASDVNEVLETLNVVEPDFTRDELYSFIPGSLNTFLDTRIAENEIPSGIRAAVLRAFNASIAERALRQSLSDSQVNAILSDLGVSEPKFEQALHPTFDDAAIQSVAAELKTYLAARGDLPQTRIDTIASVYQERAEGLLEWRGDDASHAISSDYVNRLLTLEGVEDAEFTRYSTPAALEDQVEAYLISLGEASKVANAKVAIREQREQGALRSIDDAWMRSFLASWDMPNTDQFEIKGDALETQVNGYLATNMGELRMQADGDTTRDINPTDIGSITVAFATRDIESFGDRLAGAQEMSAFNKEIGNCRAAAEVRYRKGNELTIGLGSGWTSADESYGRLAPDGISAWVRFRQPLVGFTEEVKLNGETYNVPVGNLNLFYRHIVDETVELSEDSKETAETDIIALSFDRPRENHVFRLGASYVDRRFDADGVEDQSFWRYNIGYEYRINDTMWFTAEYGDVSDDDLYSEGEFVRVGFRFDGDD